jgi:ABC-type Na+ efflux pump permease subunit
MMAFFENMYRITTPVGFIDVYYFSYLHLIIGILAISAGAGLVAADEERGVLDLIMAHPISRTALFLGRWLALGGNASHHSCCRLAHLGDSGRECRAGADSCGTAVALPPVLAILSFLQLWQPC